MTREIKFRVWDGNKMTSKIRLDFAHGFRLISGDNLDFDNIGDDKCILMQSTGLKDKNGKEIYEGDIMDIGGHPWFVTFFSAKARFGLNTRNIWKKGKPVYFFKSMEYAKENAFVIGNIYENPELLK